MNNKRYRECMAEIVGILKKYDMAGAITVVDKERCMFQYHFPTWSCITLHEDCLRLRSKLEDYPNKEAQRDNVELSVNIILQIRDIANQTLAVMNYVEKELAKKFDIEHTPFADFDPERNH